MQRGKGRTVRRLIGDNRWSCYEQGSTKHTYPPPTHTHTLTHARAQGAGVMSHTWSIVEGVDFVQTRIQEEIVLEPDNHR